MSLMQIETKFFGPQEISEADCITFKNGLPGFESRHVYTIMHYKEDSPFFILQSIEQPELALILIEFNQVAPGFSFEISDEDAAEIGLASPAEAVTYAGVVLPADISQATVNLAAPIIVGLSSRMGKQIILHHPAYQLRHPLFTSSDTSIHKKTAVR
jgi:flagellar assembly factor FliW